MSLKKTQPHKRSVKDNKHERQHCNSATVLMPWDGLLWDINNNHSIQIKRTEAILSSSTEITEMLVAVKVIVLL